MLQSLITGVVAGETAIAAKRTKAAVGAYVVAGLLIFLGVVFLLVAVWVAVRDQIGPLYASLALGGGFLVVGLLLVFLHRQAAARNAQLDAERRAREARAIAAATATTLVPSVLGSRHAFTALGIAGAALAGYAILRENQPRRRP